MNDDHVRKLSELEDVRVLNLKQHATIDYKKIPGKNFQLKTVAILSTNFSDILFLDSDNVPVKDPTFLFDHPAFIETGAMFWRDFWKTRPDNPIWPILGLECLDEYEQESGQMLFRKSDPKVYQGLKLAMYMQSKDEVYFQLTPGDKDTFRLSWRLLDLPYHMVDSHISVVGQHDDNPQTFCGHTLVQSAPGDAPYCEGSCTVCPAKCNSTLAPLFMHCNQLKYQERLNPKVMLS